MPLLSRAFGWPELTGQLVGHIPGLTYRNRVLSVEGDLAASVFDGTIVGRGFRLQDPLGPWPRMFADVTARRLDLSLVTRTFAIGSITGPARRGHQRPGAVQLVAGGVRCAAVFHAGRQSKKLISQKAVTSISNVGGGGGGVTAALQSGVLRFFDDFRYDRLGIACQLENEVCLMSGIEPAGHRATTSCKGTRRCRASTSSATRAASRGRSSFRRSSTACTVTWSSADSRPRVAG